MKGYRFRSFLLFVVTLALFFVVTAQAAPQPNKTKAQVNQSAKPVRASFPKLVFVFSKSHNQWLESIAYSGPGIARSWDLAAERIAKRVPGGTGLVCVEMNKVFAQGGTSNLSDVRRLADIFARQSGKTVLGIGVTSDFYPWNYLPEHLRSDDGQAQMTIEPGSKAGQGILTNNGAILSAFGNDNRVVGLKINHLPLDYKGEDFKVRTSLALLELEIKQARELAPTKPAWTSVEVDIGEDDVKSVEASCVAQIRRIAGLNYRPDMIGLTLDGRENSVAKRDMISRLIKEINKHKSRGLLAPTIQACLEVVIEPDGDADTRDYRDPTKNDDFKVAQLARFMDWVGGYDVPIIVRGLQFYDACDNGKNGAWLLAWDSLMTKWKRSGRVARH